MGDLIVSEFDLIRWWARSDKSAELGNFGSQDCQTGEEREELGLTTVGHGRTNDNHSPRPEYRE